jgi:hypothetical protein
VYSLAGGPGWPYDDLPYGFPLFEKPQPVLRIPIAGPEPFNTLVLVRARSFVGPGGWASGKLNSEDVVIGSDFWLAGNADQRRNPAAAHSTTGMIADIQASAQVDLTSDAATAFVWSINTVDGAFVWANGGWQWRFMINSSNLVDQVYAVGLCYLTSWVLCWEPALESEEERDLKSKIFTRLGPGLDPHEGPLGSRGRVGPHAGPRGRSRARRGPQDGPAPPFEPHRSGLPAAGR